MGCLFLLQGIFLTEELNLGLLGFLLWPVDSLLLRHLGSPYTITVVVSFCSYR